MVYLYSYTLTIDPQSIDTIQLILHCLGPSTSRCSAWLIQLQDKRKNHLSNPTMVSEHLQKGEQKRENRMYVSTKPGPGNGMRLPQCPEGWGWMFWAGRRMAVEFC